MARPGIPSELPEAVPTRERSAAELGCDRIETSFDSVSPRELSTLRTLRTVNDVFFSMVGRGEVRVMMHRQAVEWVSISSQELYRSVVAVTRALESWGLAKGDRVAILSENRPEWSTADFATLLLGAVVVPV